MINSLKGIRAWLALGVFITHLNVLRVTALNDLYSNYLIGLGAFSVLFFFMLSGFGVAVAYSKRIDKIFSVETLMFYKKRFLTLYPAHWFVLLLCCFFNINNIQSFIGSWRDLILNITLLNGLIPTRSINAVTWYLAALLVCYLLTPIIIYVVKKLDKIKINMLAIALIIYLIQLIIVFLNIDNPNQQNLFYTRYQFRIWDYIIGILMGYYYYKNKEIIEEKRKNYVKNSILEIISIIFILITFIVRPNIPVPFLQGTYYTPCIILFIYIFMRDSGIISRFLGTKLNLLASEISFEFYLIHFAVILYSNGKFPNVGITIIAEFLISIVLSIVIHILLNLNSVINNIKINKCNI